MIHDANSLFLWTVWAALLLCALLTGSLVYML